MKYTLDVTSVPAYAVFYWFYTCQIRRHFVTMHFWDVILFITIKRSTENVIDASLEINVEKTKNMLLSRHQNVGQNRDIKIANRSFRNVSQFKYLGTTVTNQNLIQEEIKRRLNSSNACYQSVQNLLSSRLL
jgi:hypothetical protein